MRSFWRALGIGALALTLSGLVCCGPAVAPEAAATPSPAATAALSPSPSPTLAPTPTPTPTPTATPTPSPTPTPTPTPTPVPLSRRDFGGQVEANLFPLWSSTPEPTPTVEPLATPNPLTEDVGKIGAMAFANVPILRWPVDAAQVLGHESYHLFYIHNLYNRRYYLVTTQEGLKGYVKASQCVTLSRQDVARYLEAARQLRQTADFYSPDAFLRELQSGRDTGSMAQRIYAALSRLGLDFEPYYYQLYEKDLDNDERYPLFYKEPVYNSLLFKLFNTAGNLVYYEDHPTQWEYVPADGQLEKGDILFFTEALSQGSSGVLDGNQFVMKGPYSGALTGCGVFLGDGQALLLRDGQVKACAWTEDLQACLDSARRIRLQIVDEKQYLIEQLIAQIYDCLGTPYNNFQRLGEYSFDCSGLISWLFLRMEISPTNYGRYAFKGTTASGFSSIKDYYWHWEKRIRLEGPGPGDPQVGLEDMGVLQRGDLVFLRKGQNPSHVGHIMVYLGNGRVIHSTSIDEEYGGTVVAFFRPELQKLYHSHLRIESIVPLKQ